MSDQALIIKDLTVTYPNGHRGLDGVCLDVAHGESLGIVGASGSGKTTLVRAVLGLLPRGTIVNGRIELDGVDLLTASRTLLRELRGRSIGYVSQDPFAACDPLRSVRHHVGEAWKSHGEKPPADQIDSRLARVAIPDPARRSRQRPHQWSGGMLQRATTVAATVHGPVLTLADEPTSALDAELADGALELLRSTCSGLLVVTHDLALAARHTDRVVVFDDGRIIEHGYSREVLAVPRHAVTRRLVSAASPLPRRLSPRMVGAPVVRAEGVGEAYTGRRDEHPMVAVAPTCVEVRPGEVTGIVGPSGSGKSTLLRLVAAMERPDTGQVVFGEQPVWGSAHSPHLPRRGYVMPVFQDPVASLDPRWPLWRTITEPLTLTQGHLSKSERRERARAELASVDMADIGDDRLPGSLSVGQCQRVAIVRALIARPALLVADEPTASLDVEAASVVSALLRLAADRGAAVLVVSHDEPRLLSYADRVLRMREGVLSHDS